MAENIKEKIEIVIGDITAQQADAIVNAANSTLLGGGGVDGAIHKAAGQELLEECKGLNGCPIGGAKITRGYKLAAKWVIHTVGPVWQGGRKNENEHLASCYRNALTLAVQNGVETIAFPAISTGAYRFPYNKAAKIAVSEATKFLNENDTIKKVLFVCFDRSAYDIYQQTVAE